MIPTRAYAAFAKNEPLAPYAFERREPGPRDVVIEIHACGVCHSDLHQVRDEWGGSVFPMVPGHEIVGRVLRVGADAKKHAVGAAVGVGCMVGSCGVCRACERGEEQYCEGGTIFTYNSTDRDGTRTQGGYATHVVVHEDFVLRLSENLPFTGAAPLLCAGITTWSPLKHWEIGPSHRVGVVGLGGLGHMGVKLAAALGAEVTVLSTTAQKEADARRLGAHDFLVTKDEQVLARSASRFDFLLDTVAAPHDLSALLQLLRTDGTMVLVGAPDRPSPLASFPLILGRRSLAGSLIGGIRETQEMLDFCGERGIVADVEVLPVAEVEQAYARMLRSDVRYRFVLDTRTL